ncbi:MAG: hypothetical protein Q8R83_09200 [Legionellaceae bacterium]|nr:hypothetical protein [Legionellaceae bacterium]
MGFLILKNCINEKKLCVYAALDKQVNTLEWNKGNTITVYPAKLFKKIFTNEDGSTGTWIDSGRMLPLEAPDALVSVLNTWLNRQSLSLWQITRNQFRTQNHIIDHKIDL